MATDDRPLSPVSDREIAAIPEGYRLTIARWLAARAAATRPSWLFPEPLTTVRRDTLYGAAVDLADPLSEDTTTVHAADVLRTLEGS